MVTIKVGMQGRVILGPAGAPGTGRRAGPLCGGASKACRRRTIMTKLERIPVTVPPDDTNVLFSHVEEELTSRCRRAGEIDSYVVYIGFDPVGAQEMDRRKPRRDRPSRRRSAR